MTISHNRILHFNIIFFIDASNIELKKTNLITNLLTNSHSFQYIHFLQNLLYLMKADTVGGNIVK